MNKIYLEFPGINSMVLYNYGLYTDDVLVIQSKNVWTIENGGGVVANFIGAMITHSYVELGPYTVTVEMFDASDTSLGTVILNTSVYIPLVANFNISTIVGDQYFFSACGSGMPDEYEWTVNGTPVSTDPFAMVRLSSIPNTVGLRVTRLVDGATNYVEFTYAIDEVLCEDKYEMLFYKKACHVYIVKDERPVNRLVILSDFKGNIISSNEIVPGEVNILVETPKDGVYEVEIRNVDDQLDSSIFVPIYDTCDTMNCYYSLVTQIQCNNENIEDCSDEKNVENEKIREALNRMTGLMFFLEKYIKIETDKYLGITIIDATRKSEIAKVDLVMRRLELTMNACTDCFSDIGIDNDCQTCK